MAKLYFYYSAMNAGKSTSLLQSAHNYEERGMQVLLMTPALDRRDAKGKITSRIGLSRDAFPFESNDDLLLKVFEDKQARGIRCVLVDEAQFLSPAQVLQLTLVCDLLELPVLCYGLRTDFRGEPFDGSKYLLAWADVLKEIKTICKSGRKAIMNARLDADDQRVFHGEQIEIGSHYLAMSRKSFKLHEATAIDYDLPEVIREHIEAARQTAD